MAEQNLNSMIAPSKRSGSSDEGVGRSNGDAVGGKRKSLDKAGGSTENAAGVSSKKRKAVGGASVDRASPAMEQPPAPDPGEDGARASSQGLRLRFTRSGNSLAARKVLPVGEVEIRSGEAEQVDGSVPKSRSATDRGGEEGWIMLSQGNDVSTPPGDAPETAPNSNSAGRAPEKSPLTREVYRIPSHAGWFNWTKVHNIEKRSLPEFFDGRSLSKTPKIYKEYRDFIINKFREKDQMPLTFTEVRRMLIGDVNALRRVFDFLDQWGLINHQNGSEVHQEPSPTPTVDDGVPNGLRVALSPAFGTMAAANLCLQGADSAVGVPYPSSSLQVQTLASYRNSFASVTAPTETGLKFNCATCGADCTKLRFNCQDETQAGLNLCPACFKMGKFAPVRSSKDFVRVGGDHGSADEKWTIKETLSLLEGIQRFGDNWSQVADFVGTRSGAECVKQFIRLPFGDRFLNDPGAEPTETGPGNSTARNVLGKVIKNEGNDAEEEVKANGDKQSGLAPRTGSGSLGHGRSDKETPSPLQDVNNPLLRQVAFMAAMVGPRVAAAAAQAAVEAIAEEEPALENHPILNGVQPSTDSRSREPSRTETKENTTLVQEDERKLSSSPSAAQLRMGISTSLAAAAVNARLLADQEEREMELLMTDIIENQVKALYAKLEHFEELEFILEKERIQVEQARQSLVAQQIQLTGSRLQLTRPG